MNLKIENYDCIQSFQLPEGWIENTAVGGFPPRTIRSFSPQDQPTVKIVILNRGIPVAAESGKTFRSLLAAAPQVVFDRKLSNKFSDPLSQLIFDLEDVLGNAGNNQIVNPVDGASGASFFIRKLETTIVNSRSILLLTGWFCNPETGQQMNSFYGLFTDFDANEKGCNVEQIFLETPEEDLYVQYLPAFQECIKSIEWLAAPVRSNVS